MGREVENFCVGCPQGCINCGRKHDVTIYYCDECETQDVDLYEWNGRELCEDCIKEELLQIICDDMDSPHCEGCGCESDILYKPEDKWICEDCLDDYLSFLRIEKGDD